MIVISRLAKMFEHAASPALAGIDAEIHPGRITGLVGPDGSGKTTLLRIVAGLLRPSEGIVRIDGLESGNGTSELHRILGYMPQHFGLYEELSVVENLRLYADLRDVVGGDRDETFSRLLEFTGLAPFTTRLARRLSGGMKQKLGLACALIQKPRLLLLDEPSVGVDPVSRRELWRMVRDLISPDTTIVWSTAYLDEAEQCDDVLLLNAGRLLFSGPPGELTRRVEGRVFQVRGVPDTDRRRFLSRILQQPGVRDGVIQGRAVRIVLAESADLPALDDQPRDVRIDAAPPRFEDAFVDMLGGGSGTASALARRMPAIKDDGRPAVEARGLTKRFGKFTAVENNSFVIRRGEIFGLLGPNGAGKSTTFKMMCGLLKPSAGEGFVAGLHLRHAAADARSRLGYMAQKFSLYGDLSVRQNLDFFSGVYGLRGREQREATSGMAEIFDLGPFLDASARELPLGFQQRLALACAVMHRPDVLFLDEPTSGVDPITRREFWGHINGLVEKGVTVLVTTHFMDEAEYCDRIGLIYQGRKIAEGSPDALKAGVRSESLPEPSLEDAFIALIRQWEPSESRA
ncbi:MAG: ATP-binding cassette domain-containing protein [Desulfobacterales bacterium]